MAKGVTFIKDVVQSGYILAWKPNNNYRIFHNDRPLSKEEKELIVKWVDSKMPEGSAAYIQGTQYLYDAIKLVPIPS